ncbi:MAG TPA: T9SS type A sorting domain-containing protein [Ignavibacteriaceae bacterium]|nr:T9SS type A sorting domain-containing protein [Ignavibacteriaceae bacterium]
MKNIVLFLFFSISTTFAQVAADYYLPFTIGNYLKHYSVGQNWTGRTQTYSIVGTDMIGGNLYYIEVGAEVLNSDTNTFRVVWLRKDSAGNVLLGAISPSGSLDLDSAIIFDMVWVPNEYGNLGYSRTVIFGEESVHDTVLSISETVTVSAGTYINCVKVRETSLDNLGNTTMIEDQYYAYGIGMVKTQRTFPSIDAHTSELINFNIITSNQEDKILLSNFSLEQNYPNPFNPITTIQFSIESKSFVSLKVFDLLGREAATLISEEINSGIHSVNWDASEMQSGVYFYELKTEGFSETKKLVLLK